MLELTGSPVAVGALALVQTLPVTVLALFGGRSPTASTSGGWCQLRDGARSRRPPCSRPRADRQRSRWQLYVLRARAGHRLALDTPARHTLVFPIVGREDITNAVALSSSLGTTARIVGPALGGLVVATFGAGVAFGLNALSYGS